jgi:5-(carboxyamino)imidazole ribonucleotide synthase
MLFVIKTVGILGGGQLARMMAQAAQTLGINAHIYAPEPDNPAFDVTRFYTIADYGDEKALAKFASEVDVITYEFENVPYECALFLDALKPVYPPPSALKISQDRLLEKQFLKEFKIETAGFHAVNCLEDLKLGVAKLGLPAVLKTRRFGYDGKGQVKINEASDLEQAYAEIKNAPAILESFVNFEFEMSVIIARDLKGETVSYDICHNVHENHILHKTYVPMYLGLSPHAKAMNRAVRIIEKLNYVGILAVEMFLDGRTIVINELAPRVHNSGHWTLGGAVTSQFSQHIRAICGLPLGSTRMVGRKIEMTNLIGDDTYDLNEPNTIPVLYGKKESRLGRKMGHVTKIN